MPILGIFLITPYKAGKDIRLWNGGLIPEDAVAVDRYGGYSALLSACPESG